LRGGCGKRSSLKVKKADGSRRALLLKSDEAEKGLARKKTIL